MTEQRINPAAAFGRRLSDLWLDGEEGKLHPAEWKLLECAARGEVCRLGDERPVVATEENRVRAEIVRFVALGGDDSHPLHEHGVHIRGAYISCGEDNFDLSGAKMPFGLFILDSVVDGGLLLNDVIGKTISLAGTKLEGIFADRLVLMGDFFIRNNIVVTGLVRMSGAKISGNLDCSNGNFHGEHPIILELVEILGSVFLGDGFNSSQEVILIGARISGNLSCRGGSFLGKKISLNFQAAKISGALLLDSGFYAKGMINLHSATIGTELLIKDATFSCKDKSIHAPRAKIGGNVELGKECRVAGQVSFQGASIGGDLTFSGGSFEGKPAINLRNAQIDGTLVWRGVEHARGELNLSGASCLTLNMDRNSWEKPSQIRLDNFTFKGFTELPEGCNAQFWRDWLERQPEKYLTTRFRPNPYNQLAGVLDRMGHEQEAKSIRVEQRRRQSEFTRLYEPLPYHDSGRLTRNAIVFWNAIQGALVDYGYRPGKAVAYLLGFVVFGSIVFHMAARDGIITPTHPLIFKEVGKNIPKACADNWVYFPKAAKADCEAAIPSEYSEFNSIMYSIDLALPIVNFRMENDWAPRVVTQQGKRYWPGWWVRTWEWVQIAAGWMLSLLFVSAIGGIIRR